MSKYQEIEVSLQDKKLEKPLKNLKKFQYNLPRQQKDRLYSKKH